MSSSRTFGLFFIFAGIMHFVIPRAYHSIVPDYLPRKRALVYASGVAEIAGGAGVLVRPLRQVAAWWSIATLVAVFPANLHMAIHYDRYRNVPGGRVGLLLRLPVQLLFIAWAHAAARDI
jgi:uncharacterized membrane protein